MFKKLIKRLYLKHCEPDLAAISREQLRAFDSPVLLDELKDKEKDVYYDGARKLKEDKTLKYVLEKLVEEIKDGVWHRSVNEQIVWDRFTLNGVYMVKERIEALASLIPEKEEEFDKHAIL